MIWVDVTPRAARRVRTMLDRDDRPGRYGLRIALADTGSEPSDTGGETGGEVQYKLSLAPTAREDELVLPRHGFDVFVAKDESERLNGVRIDYVESDDSSGFLVDRPARAMPGAGPQTGSGGGPTLGVAADAAPLPGTSPELEARVAAALEEVRPVLVGDGGDVELVSVGDGAAYVRLQGACSGCGAALLTLTQLIETTVAAAVPEVPRTVLVA